MPDAPIAGLPGVLSVGFVLSAVAAEAVGSVLSSSLARPSSREVVPSLRLVSLEAFSEAVGWEQEPRIPTIKAMKSILPKYTPGELRLSDQRNETGREKQPKISRRTGRMR